MGQCEGSIMSGQHVHTVWGVACRAQKGLAFMVWDMYSGLGVTIVLCHTKVCFGRVRAERVIINMT